MELNYREMLNARSLSISDKQLITDAYRTTFNRDLTAKTSCRSCFNDALAELINSTKKGYQLRSGVVIEFKGKLYAKSSENLPLELIELYKDKMQKL